MKAVLDAGKNGSPSNREFLNGKGGRHEDCRDYDKPHRRSAEKPFKTALRTVRTAEAVIVKVTAENGMTGWGEAPPTAVITGETLDSIEGQSTRFSHPPSPGATCEWLRRYFMISTS